jgi:2-polyprenyl-3-methyl-5-hydroxy-6-metoxy-1,4-benzoquinol methylase
MTYNTLLPLLQKTKSQLSPEKFQERINVVFHNYEADQYDKMHLDMWESLQEQINLLVDDLFNSEAIPSKSLRLLDIGCGTGLSTQILLNSKLGSYIDSRTWDKKYSIVNKYVSDLKEKWDVVIICSVLHHIPDLNQFLSQVDQVLNPGGILIHLQDPNGDCLNDCNYLKRVEQYNNEMSLLTKKKKVADFVPKKWKQYINRQIGRKTYIDLVNDQLIAEKVIKKRMSADEIWSVTDIHVETKKNSINKGISFQFLCEKLDSFTLINQRSYGFYGALVSDLSTKYRRKEEQFIVENQLNGRNISCIWVKNQ